MHTQPTKDSSLAVSGPPFSPKPAVSARKSISSSMKVKTWSLLRSAWRAPLRMV